MDEADEHRAGQLVEACAESSQQERRERDADIARQQRSDTLIAALLASTPAEHYRAG